MLAALDFGPAVWILICWGVAALAMLGGYFLGHGLGARKAGTEARPVPASRHRSPEGRGTGRTGSGPPPPVPTTRAIRAQPQLQPRTEALAVQAQQSDRGQPLCRCDHDLLDHAMEPPEPCFTCDCGGFRPRTGSGGRHG
jgi:hypothetical protein